MSFPTIPNITPSISITREDTVNLLLLSIAFEELGLAHIINAEAEKIQAVLGTLPGVSFPDVTIGTLVAVNQTVNKTLKTVIKKEMLLQFKLEEIIENLLPSSSSSSTTTSTTSTTTTSTTSTMTTTTTAAGLYIFGDVASVAGITAANTTVVGSDAAFYHAIFTPAIVGYSFTENLMSGVPTIDQPFITVEKLVSVDGGKTFVESEVPPGPQLSSGKPFFLITVFNNGNAELFNVTVTDPSLGLVKTISSIGSGARIQILATPS